MNFPFADFLFIVVVLCLLILMLYLYRKNKKAMRENVKGILDEYEKLKAVTEKLRLDADGIIAQNEKTAEMHESLKTESDKIKDALLDARHKNKSEMDIAVKDIKKNMKSELTRELEGMMPRMKPEAAMKKEKEFGLDEGHLAILSKLASVENELSLKVIRDHFSELFPAKKRKDFESSIRELAENLLIREAYAEAGDFYYTISNLGIQRLKRTSEDR